LLHFWSSSLANHEKDLAEFEHFHDRWQREGLQLITIQVDPASRPGSRSFPILAASEDVLAAYSLLFRQLFDRHRDMSVPISFLMDPSGQVVKIYQGTVPKEHVSADSKSIPHTDAERLAKGLPFPGFTQSYDFGRNYLSLGFVFFERGYFAQAEAFFAQATKDDPQSAEALYGLGSAYLQQQKTSEASDCFQRALQLHPSYPGTIPNSWNNLGILSAREGNTDSAIQYFQRALQIDPEHSIALLNLGNAYRQKKDWAQAQRVLERALALNPDEPEANFALGMVYAQQNDTDRAYGYLQKALAARPAYPEALNNLGILYLRTRRIDQAIRSFEDSIRLAPEYDQSYLNLARVYAIQGEREKAKTILRELLNVHPDHPLAIEALQQLEQ
ncbi:MAG TPA: tetratricopeptide repeat protein, partial [Candidatus Limnocylindrales bacterium]|nr:tetratricopeptide repeat protein [Candidatus Limnocylindrales bacterium]